MKKILIGVLVLGLSGLATVYVTSCAKQSGPLSPNINYLGTGNSANKNMLKVIGASWPSAVSATASVYFNIAVDPATFNQSTVQIYVLDDTGVSVTIYQSYGLSYNAISKSLTIYPNSNDAWINNKRYHVILTTGIRTLNGVQLDGNDNNIPESEEFDNVHGSFEVGAPAALDTNHRYVAAGTPVWTSNDNPGGAGFSFGGYSNIANTSYTNITITVQFLLSGTTIPGFSMDVSSFFTDATHLNPNVILIDGNNTPVAPVDVSITSTANPNAYDTLHIAFVATPGSKYKFKLKGGLAGIRSSNDGTKVLMRGFYLDGNDNMKPEANDDSKFAMLQTNAVTPVIYVTGGSYEPSLRRFVLTFDVPTGIGILDPNSANAATFLLRDEPVGVTNTAIVPTSIVVDNSLAPHPKVYVYVPLKFVDSPENLTRSVRVIVTNQVKSADGYLIDQNGDGVTGTDADYFSYVDYNVTSLGQ